MKKERNMFLLAGVLTMLFGLVYELFSHQVYSSFMIFASLIPLLGGALPYALLERMTEEKQPGILCRMVYNSGIAALTAGSLFQGVLEIYGTTSPLSATYWYVGSGLCLLGVVTSLIKVR